MSNMTRRAVPPRIGVHANRWFGGDAGYAALNSNRSRSMVAGAGGGGAVPRAILNCVLGGGSKGSPGGAGSQWLNGSAGSGRLLGNDQTAGYVVASGKGDGTNCGAEAGGGVAGGGGGGGGGGSLGSAPLMKARGRRRRWRWGLQRPGYGGGGRRRIDRSLCPTAPPNQVPRMSADASGGRWARAGMAPSRQ